MVKQLILIRHGHRDNSNRMVDNGLSGKGEKQAKWLRRYAESRFDRREWRDLKAVLLSSPKKRCVETLTGISDHMELPVETRPELDEQKANETFAAFSERVHGFLNWWMKDAPPVVVVCSHGDWLPLAIFHLLGTTVEMKKGAWLEIECDQGQGVLKWYIPGFKCFYET
jgi:broad specificity phosphatase PhoE